MRVVLIAVIVVLSSGAQRTILRKAELVVWDRKFPGVCWKSCDCIPGRYYCGHELTGWKIYDDPRNDHKLYMCRTGGSMIDVGIICGNCTGYPNFFCACEVDDMYCGSDLYNMNWDGRYDNDILYRCENEGKSVNNFTKCRSGTCLEGSCDCVPDQLYCEPIVSSNSTLTPLPQIFVGTEHGLLISNDDGYTWVGKTKLHGLYYMENGDEAIYSVLVLENWVYVVTSLGLSMSNDGGQTWVSAKIGKFTPTSSPWLNSVVGSDDKIYLKIGENLFLSKDKGQTWEELEIPLSLSVEVDSIPNDIAVVGEQIYLSGDNELYASDNCGQTWTVILDDLQMWNERDGNVITNILVVGNQILIGTMGGHLAITKSNRRRWTWRWHTLGDQTIRSIFAAEDGVFYVGTVGGGLFISYTEGRTWVKILTCCNDTITSIFALGTRIYAGLHHFYHNNRFGGLAMSNDGGRTWQHRLKINTHAVFDSKNKVSCKNSASCNSERLCEIDQLYCGHELREAGEPIIRNHFQDLINCTSPFLSLVEACGKCWQDKGALHCNGTRYDIFEQDSVNYRSPSLLPWICLGILIPLLFIIFSSLLIRMIVKQKRLKQILLQHRIDANQLTIAADVKLLGVGQFGEVWPGRFRQDNGRSSDVALKMSKHHLGTGPGLASADCFFQEITALDFLKHKNIIRMFGVCSNFEKGSVKGPVLVLEYMNGGNSIDYIRSEQVRLTGKELVRIFVDISQAGKYLYDVGVVHRDIGARNVLVQKDLQTGQPIVAKLTDFGLAKDIGKATGMYKSSGRTVLPARYTPPEGFKRGGNFTSQSDVWSFGVFMWEVYMLIEEGPTIDPKLPGPLPYGQFTKPEEVFEKIISGHRLQQPLRAPNEMFTIMNNCWSFKPELRPTFNQLINTFGTLQGLALQPRQSENSQKIIHHYDPQSGYTSPRLASCDGHDETAM